MRSAVASYPRRVQPAAGHMRTSVLRAPEELWEVVRCSQARLDAAGLRPVPTLPPGGEVAAVARPRPSWRGRGRPVQTGNRHRQKLFVMHHLRDGLDGLQMHPDVETPLDSRVFCVSTPVQKRLEAPAAGVIGCTTWLVRYSSSRPLSSEAGRDSLAIPAPSPHVVRKASERVAGAPLASPRCRAGCRCWLLLVRSGEPGWASSQ
jgi:hypothetical protein